MTDSKLTLVIKKTNIKKLIMPILFVVFIVIYLLHNPIYNLLCPIKVKELSVIDSLAKSKHYYVSCSVDNLYYSGEVHTNQKNEIICAYYYTIDNNKCYYFALSTKTPGVLETDGRLALHIDHVNITAKLYQKNNGIPNIISKLSKSLEWSSPVLSAMSDKTLINQYQLSLGYEYALLTFIILMFIMCVLHLVIIIASIINPLNSKTVFNLSKYGNRIRLYRLAEAEYGNVNASTEGLLITPNFFIAYDAHNVHIVPLENIVWAYKFGTLSYRPLLSKLSYSICVVTDDKKSYVTHRKSKSSVEYTLNELSERFPEIMIGYHDKQKKHFRFISR